MVEVSFSTAPWLERLAIFLQKVPGTSLFLIIDYEKGTASGK